jgi:hypothetical protein
MAKPRPDRRKSYPFVIYPSSLSEALRHKKQALSSNHVSVPVASLLSVFSALCSPGFNAGDPINRQSDRYGNIPQVTHRLGIPMEFELLFTILLAMGANIRRPSTLNGSQCLFFIIENFIS